MQDLILNQQELPNSIEAEQALLGALLRDNKVYKDIASIISFDDFYNITHERIYSILANSIESGQFIDAIVLKNKLSESELLQDFGGVEYIALLLEYAPIGAAVSEYASIIKEASVRRNVAKLCEKTKIKVLDSDNDDNIQLILSKLVDDVSNAHADSANKQAFTTTQEGVHELFFGETGRVIETGIADIDNEYPLMTQGVTILGGRSSQGKSAVAAQIALNASKLNQRVDYFTLEMTSAQVIARLTTSEMCSSGSFLAYRELTSKKFREKISEELFDEAIATAHSLPEINWNEKSGLTVSDIICNVLKDIEGGKKPDLVIIDYINLISDSDIKQGRDIKKNEILGQQVLRLREFAKANDLCVLLLVQLNRNAVHRSDMGRPVMEDIKESGDIEQLADAILLVYRKALYIQRLHGNDMPSEVLEEYTYLQDKVEIICAKQRMGPTGSAMLNFSLKYNYISEIKY